MLADEKDNATSHRPKTNRTASPCSRDRKIRSTLPTLAVLLAFLIGVRGKIVLPSDFSERVGPSGLEIVWTPPTGSPARVTVGGSRYEYRLPSGVVVGYPLEEKGTLVLPLTSNVKSKLDKAGGGAGETLQVWRSGRRIDSGAPTPPRPAASSTVSPLFANETTYSVTPTPTIPLDPAAPGGYATRRTSYDLRPGVNISGFPALVELSAEVTYPGSPAPPSGTKFPLVLFMHGRHVTCYNSALELAMQWPCPAGYSPVPSHRGYRYVADILASQGYVTASISANGINAYDGEVDDAGAAARSLLIHHHLRLWARWNNANGVEDPWRGLFRNKLDMTNVVLVGHSRGGEGVHRAAIDARGADPYKIVGLVSYGPTAYGVQVTPDVPSATILPSCDGDVSELQGQFYIDASRDIAYSPALRSAVIALGANHNYFNTEWTPGISRAPSEDDWFDPLDPVCGSKEGIVRLSAREQQAVGAAYTLALIRLSVKQEAAMLPLLDGSWVRPAAIGRAEVATHAVGGAGYRLLYRPEGAAKPTLTNGMRGRVCVGYSSTDGSSSGVCVPGAANEGPASTPHWLRRYSQLAYPSPRAMALQWTRKVGATARFAVPRGQRDFSSLDFITVRVANDPKRANGARFGFAKFGLLIQDGRGRSALLRTSIVSVEGWPGTEILDRVHARALRGDLSSMSMDYFDITNVVAVLLVAQTSSGKVWVIDIAASKNAVAQPTALNLPVLSVDKLVVPEGVGNQTINVRITSDRPLTSSAAVWVELYDTTSGEYSASQLNLGPGATKLVSKVPFSWSGDKFYNLPQGSMVVLGAISNAVTGNYFGGVSVVEDDPIPRLSVVKATVKAAEGKSLEWKFRLSSPTSGMELWCQVYPPWNGRTELRTNDVTRAWLLASTDPTGVPAAPTPLSDLDVHTTVRFVRGSTTARLVVPIVPDRVAEGVEWISFYCIDTVGLIEDGVAINGKVLAGRRRKVKGEKKVSKL